MSDERDPVARLFDLNTLRVAMRSDLDTLNATLERRIREEEETTRRHFDMMAERVEESVQVLTRCAPGRDR